MGAWLLCFVRLTAASGMKSPTPGSSTRQRSVIRRDGANPMRYERIAKWECTTNSPHELFNPRTVTANQAGKINCAFCPPSRRHLKVGKAYWKCLNAKCEKILCLGCKLIATGDYKYKDHLYKEK